MTVLSETMIVQGEGVTLERMLWKRDRAYTPGLVELALDTNPGVADLGLVLPVGSAVALPLASQVSGQGAVEVIRLWD
jgi:phage tail protein X